MTSTDLVIGLGASAAWSAAVIGVWARPWRRGSTGLGRPPADWPSAVGIAGAYVLGHGLGIGWAPLPPVEAQDWLMPIAAVAVVVEMICAVIPRAAVQWGLRLLAAGGACAMTTWWRVGVGTWSSAAAVLWIAAAAAAVTAAWALQSWQARRGPAGAVWQWGLMTAGLSIVVLLGGFAKLALLAGALATALGVLWLLACGSLRVGVRPATVAVVVLLWSAMLINGHFLAQVPASAAALLAIVPLATVLGELPGLARRRTLSAVVRSVVVGVLIGLAAWWTSAAAPEPYEY